MSFVNGATELIVIVGLWTKHNDAGKPRLDSSRKPTGECKHVKRFGEGSGKLEARLECPG